ncbi:MAG: hypothetical protein ACFFDF_20160 [Candidatus Odinarchaeota archaeon]
MQGEIFFRLITNEDFDRLRKRISSINNDRVEINKGKEPLIILDYFVLYLLCSKDQSAFRKKLVRYCMNSDYLKRSKKYILPITYWEMEGNIKHVKNNIQTVDENDFVLLYKNKSFLSFKEAIIKWKENRADPEARRSVLYAFKNILAFEFDNKKITEVLFKVITFFFYDKIYVSTYKNILDTISSDDINIISTQQLLEYTSLRGLKYDQKLYSDCFTFLNGLRNKDRPDMVDSICYATAVNIQDFTQNKFLVNFFSSEIPFEVFFFNDLLSKGNKSLIRDPLQYGLNRYIKDRCGNEAKQEDTFINEILINLKRVLGNKQNNIRDIYYAKKSLSDQIREEMIKSINQLKSTDAHPFVFLFNDDSIEDFIDDDELKHAWYNNVYDLIEKLDNLANLSKEQLVNEIEIKKRSAIKDIDDFMDYFHSFLSNQQHMEFHIKSIKKRIYKIEQDRKLKSHINPVDNLENLFDTILYACLSSKNQYLIEHLKIEYMLNDLENRKIVREKIDSIIDKYVNIGNKKKLYDFVANLYKLKSIINE